MALHSACTCCTLSPPSSLLAHRYIQLCMPHFFAHIRTGIASSILFFLNRIFVLRRERSTTFAIWVFPVLVYLTVFINGASHSAGLVLRAAS